MYIHTPHPIQIHRHGQRTSLRHQISIDQGVFTDKFYIGRDLIDRLLYIEISPENREFIGSELVYLIER